MTQGDVPGDRWSLFMQDDDTIGCNMITPTFGGGGVVVMRVSDCPGASAPDARAVGEVRLTAEESAALARYIEAHGIQYGADDGLIQSVLAKVTTDA